MTNENLNILKDKVREIYELVCQMQVPVEQKEDLSQEKFDALMQRTEQIIEQNAKIIDLAQQLIDRPEPAAAVEMPSIATVEPEPVIESPQPEPEPVVETPEPEPEPVVETPQPEPEPVVNQNEEVENLQNEVEKLQAELEKYMQAGEQAQTPQQEPTATEEPKQQEKSSVLDFLHNRVYKETTETSSLKTIVSQPEEPQDEPTAEPPVEEKPQNTPHTQQTLFSTKTKSIADIYESKTRKSLEQSIGISFKFMFINDLFAGVTENYFVFIKKLNDAKTLSESMQIIENMRKEKRWPKSSTAYNELIHFVEKRFE